MAATQSIVPESKKFWMIFLSGGGAPMRQHKTLTEVSAEAVRLTEQTGRRAYVLEAIGSFKVKKVKAEATKPLTAITNV